MPLGGLYHAHGRKCLTQLIRAAIRIHGPKNKLDGPGLDEHDVGVRVALAPMIMEKLESCQALTVTIVDHEQKHGRLARGVRLFMPKLTNFLGQLMPLYGHILGMYIHVHGLASSCLN